MGERLKADGVDGVAGVADQLAQEDVLVRVQRVNDEVEKLLQFGLEGKCFWHGTFPRGLKRKGIYRGGIAGKRAPAANGPAGSFRERQTPRSIAVGRTATSRAVARPHTPGNSKYCNTNSKSWINVGGRTLAKSQPEGVKSISRLANMALGTSLFGFSLIGQPGTTRIIWLISLATIVANQSHPLFNGGERAFLGSANPTETTRFRSLASRLEKGSHHRIGQLGRHDASWPLPGSWPCFGGFVEKLTVYVLRPKDRSTLQLQWIDPDTGQRKTRSAETSDLEKAEDARADLEYELRHGKYQEASKLDWDRFRQLFEEEYLAGLRPRSREKYGTVLDVFEAIICPAKFRQITERTVSAFVKGMRERKQPGTKKIGLAPMTIKNYLVCLKTSLSWAVDQKLLSTLPTFPTVKVPKKKPQPIPAESFEKLLAKAPDTLWKAFLLCGRWAGLRLSEARELRWASSTDWPWIDWELNRIVLPAVFAKSNEDQAVPMHPILRQTLSALPRTHAEVFPFRSRRGGGRLSRVGVSTYVRHLAKRRRQAGDAQAEKRVWLPRGEAPGQGSRPGPT